jgi:hypothetical protein
MKEGSSGNLEMAIVLPLGVVGHQLMRIEADLRLLHMKASHFAGDRENAPQTRLIEARFEQISEALDSIRTLVEDIAAELHPQPSKRKPRLDRDD